jgi:hypothetical protein
MEEDDLYDRRNMFAFLERDVSDIEKFPIKEKQRVLPKFKSTKAEFNPNVENILLLVKAIPMISHFIGSVHALGDLSIFGRFRYTPLTKGTTYCISILILGM